MRMKMKKKWTVGTRGSRLALTQAEIVVSALRRIHGDCEFIVRPIITKGDTIWDKPLHLIGGKGLFVKEIEEELLRGDIDFAVHSMKDLPTEMEEGLLLAAVLEREDPRDVFLSLNHSRFSDLGGGASIGTNSLRRKAQVLHFNKGIDVVPLRGNVDTRIRKMKELGLDGIILAYAGVKRMGFEDQITEVLPFDIMIPASGQGAIGIETRQDPAILEMVRAINHPRSFDEIAIERKVQTGIGGSCTVPLGVYARVAGDLLTLMVSFGTEDGRLLIHEARSCSRVASDALINDILGVLRAGGNGV
jgi:hydroxymethylbilane synthase